MSSVFKSRSFQSKNCASSPFLHGPPNLLHTDPVLDVSLKRCTVFFFGGGGWHPSTWLASWERPALCGSHQVFVLQRPLRVNDL